jgi:hypothetical protein
MYFEFKKSLAIYGAIFHHTWLRHQRLQKSFGILDWVLKECPPINCLINPETLMSSKKEEDGMLSLCITG